MPPKIAQKRLRESTAENGSTSPAIGTAAVAGGEDRVGEGASTIRRTGASSISSDTAASGDGDDGDNPPRMKRSRRSDRPKQQQSDGEQQQEDKDVVMEDEQEGRQAGAGAAWGVAAAGSSKKPASGRRVTTASRRKGSIDSSGGDHTEEEDTEAEAEAAPSRQAPSKRVRKSSSGATKVATASRASVPASSESIHSQQPQPTPTVTNGRQSLLATTANGPAGGRPPRKEPHSAARRTAAAAAAAAAAGSGSGSESAAPNNSARQSALRNGGASSSAIYRRQSQGQAAAAAKVNGSANGVANGGANGSASGNSNGSANGSANGRAVAAADSAAKVAASGSPTRGGVLSSVNIRQIAGSESPVTGSDNQCAVESSAVRRLNSAGVGGLEDEKGGRIGMWAAHWKARALELRQGFQELDISTALPAAQNTALRLMVPAAYLLAARFIWMVTLMVVGTRNSHQGGSKDFPGSTPQAAALQTVLKHEAYGGMLSLLEEQSRRLSETRALAGKVDGSLSGLFDLRKKLDENVIHLRAQISDAAKGVPQQPEITEDVSLSQLKELQKLKRATEGLVADGRNAVEDGEVWASDAKNNLQRNVRNVKQQTADYAYELTHDMWDSDFARPLDHPRFVMEQLSRALDDTLQFAADPSNPDAASAAAGALVLEKEDAESIAEEVKMTMVKFSTEGWTDQLQERIEDAVAQQDFAPRDNYEYSQMVFIKIAEIIRLSLGMSGHMNKVRVEWDQDALNTAARGGSKGLLETRTQAKQLVEKEVEIFATGGTGMPDYAWLRSGASVVYGPILGEHRLEKLTSDTLAQSVLPWAPFVLHVLRMPGYVHAEGADAALSMSNTLGSCFAFQGGVGRLTVKLAPYPGSPDPTGYGRVKVTHISIEHARSAAAPTAAQSAPRVFRVTGWDQDPAGTDDNSGDNNNATVTVAVATQEGRKAPEDNQGEEQDKIRLLRPYLLIERAEYLVEDGAPGVQTFAVSDEILRAAPAVGWVTLETQSNHGGRWTCLYGLRVHGQPVKNA